MPTTSEYTFHALLPWLLPSLLPLHVLCAPACKLSWPIVAPSMACKGEPAGHIHILRDNPQQGSPHLAHTTAETLFVLPRVGRAAEKLQDAAAEMAHVATVVEATSQPMARRDPLRKHMDLIYQEVSAMPRSPSVLASGALGTELQVLLPPEAAPSGSALQEPCHVPETYKGLRNEECSLAKTVSFSAGLNRPQQKYGAHRQCQAHPSSQVRQRGTSGGASIWMS